MKKTSTYYSFYPKVVRVKKRCSFCISALNAAARFQDDAYRLEIVPLCQSLENSDKSYETFNVESFEGRLCFDYIFDEEQEYRIGVFSLQNSGAPLAEFPLYALGGDLFERIPYKGDLHVHSSYSHDGVESPEYVAASYRKRGYDFIAITDHGTPEGSLVAIDFFNESKTGLLILKGEEVHPPFNHIHTVNVGFDKSVNDFFRTESERALGEIRLLAERQNPQGVNAFEYASNIYTYKKIKEFNGLSILCHPFWQPKAYHMPEKMLELLFENREFDCFEVLGGHEVTFNNLQTAFYSQKRAEGQKIPIVGSNDSHGTEDTWRFDWFYTIAFCRGFDSEGIKEAILSGQSVAVESYPNERIRIYGDFRLVKYALFLQQEYFPLHDELCFDEGIQMKTYKPGDASLSSKTAAFAEIFFSR